MLYVLCRGWSGPYDMLRAMSWSMNCPKETHNMFTPEAVGVSSYWFNRLLLIFLALGLELSTGTPSFSTSHLNSTHCSTFTLTLPSSFIMWRLQEHRHNPWEWDQVQFCPRFISYCLPWVRVIVVKTAHGLFNCTPGVMSNIVTVSTGGMILIATRISPKDGLSLMYYRGHAGPHDVGGKSLQK